MTSRRITSSKKDFEETEGVENHSPNTSKKSIITPAVPASVIYKLLAFTAAMVVGPIGTYFLTLNSIFRGNPTFAGATAAFMANVVLIAYVIVAMKEDESDRIAAEERARKGE